MDTETKQVLVVSSPQKTIDELRETRDYIMECLSVGVMVLSLGMGYELVEFPPLSGVCVANEEHPILRAKNLIPTVVVGGGKKSPPPTVKSEKIIARDKLLAYRAKEGLGCLGRLASATGGKVNAETLRNVINGEETLTSDQWQRVSKAIDALQKSGGADE